MIDRTTSGSIDRVLGLSSGRSIDQSSGTIGNILNCAKLSSSTWVDIYLDK